VLLGSILSNARKDSKKRGEQKKDSRVKNLCQKEETRRTTIEEKRSDESGIDEIRSIYGDSETLVACIRFSPAHDFAGAKRVAARKLLPETG
jgi:hypothetical protein